MSQMRKSSIEQQPSEENQQLFNTVSMNQRMGNNNKGSNSSPFT